MGKKKVKGGLGKSIIRDRFGKQRRPGPESHLHTSELGDGYDWNRINLRSVTEETSLDEFLATAELAGTEFIAERMNIKFVSEEARAGLLSSDEANKIEQAQKDHRDMLRIPRRPHWDKQMSAEQLDINERESFLEWRRQLATLQDVDGIVMTPFERNLDFWRQLWRVTERSDVVVQIVDARNPLLFRCEDLEKYVKEVDSSKTNMLLINKADYLTQKQRELWASYFDRKGLLVAFWSAVEEKERLEGDKAVDGQTDADSDADYKSSEDEDTLSEDADTDDRDTDSVDDGEEGRTRKDGPDPLAKDHKRETTASCEDCQELQKQSDMDSSSVCVDAGNTASICDRVGELSTGEGGSQFSNDGPKQTDGNVPEVRNNPNILNGLELIELLRSLCTSTKGNQEVSVVGLVGYPNVGKSSSINALLQTKKVPVSATPGRTKHFQTLFLDKTLMLCDCPGLVMPSFVNTKAEMVLNGILPIDQMRDYVAPVATLATLIPRPVLEAVYGIMIARPREGEDENRPPTAHELLSAYGYMRGFMTHKGIPDFQRSARNILKDFVNGKLLYCTPPPGVDIEDFCPTPAPHKPAKERGHPQPAPVGSRQKVTSTLTSEVDQMFFEKIMPSMGLKGSAGSTARSCQEGLGQTMDSNTPSSSQTSLVGKPWKKHHNRGKKEKLRRIHSHLDA